MNLTWSKKRLELKDPWTLSRGTSTSKEYWFLEVEHDGITGLGEAAHNDRYGESPASIEAFFTAAAGRIGRRSPALFQSLSQEINVLQPGQCAAKAALDMAFHDWAGKKLGVPLHVLLGLDAATAAPTGISIGIGTGDEVRRKVSAAAGAGFPALKIKLGGENDEEMVSAVRSVTSLPIRIDANEGWTDRQQALERIEWLAGENAELVEQPMPAGRLDDMRWLRERSPLPLFADEDLQTPSSLAPLAGAFDGINIKLMKAGGIQPALRLAHAARCLDLDIMLGCMIESSLGITAAAQIAPLADVLDLDGNLLIANDPFQGVQCREGILTLPEEAGLGVVPRSPSANG